MLPTTNPLDMETTQMCLPQYSYKLKLLNDRIVLHTSNVYEKLFQTQPTVCQHLLALAISK